MSQYDYIAGRPPVDPDVEEALDAALKEARAIIAADWRAGQETDPRELLLTLVTAIERLLEQRGH